ncbi:hypothetical protein D1007_05699 [Hordeum vulgare]|nr:hypothetical protein D1007_05699 [Hordeum vulgare]
MPLSKPSAQTHHILTAMSETSGEIKTLHELLLKRVEAGHLAADKHVEAQLTFNKKVSSDLTHLHKQVDLTQSDVDEVRQHHDQSKSTDPLSPRHHPQAYTAPPPEQPFVRLANAGPPLIEMRPGRVTLGGGAAALPAKSLPGRAPGHLHGQAAQARLP